MSPSILILTAIANFALSPTVEAALFATPLTEGLFFRTDAPLTKGSEPISYARLKRASVQISAPSMLHAASGECTATVISPDGLLLTARHCVEGCFRPARDADGLIQRERLSGVNGRIDEVDPTVKCEGTLGTQKAKFEILAAGLSPDIFSIDDLFGDETYPSYRELRLKGYAESGDFAILKTAAARGLPCASIDWSEMKVDERIFSIGFPAKTARGDQHDSDGRSQYLSLGRVTKGIEENSGYLRAVKNGGDVSILLPQLKRQYDDLGLVFTTLDAMNGSSGGGVFNAHDGRVRALISHLVGGGAEKNGVSISHESGSTQVLTVSQIRNVLKQTMTDRQINQLAMCPL